MAEEAVVRIAESIVIDRSPEEVFAFLALRANDPVWMASVVESDWLDAAAPLAVGRRGRMVMKALGRRSEYIDEVTDYVPGRRIAHRTVEGPIDLNTACITEPEGTACRVTVVAETDRFVGGPLRKLADPIVAQIVRRRFRSDLGKLKGVLQSEAAAAR